MTKCVVQASKTELHTTTVKKEFVSFSGLPTATHNQKYG